MFANGFQWRDTATNQFYLPALSTFISMTHNVGGGGVTGTESRNAYEQKKKLCGAQNGNRNETPLPHLSIYKKEKKNIYEKQTIVDFSTQSNQFFPIAL